MSLNIAQKLYHPMNELGDHLSIPLLVGPSSVTLAGKPIQKSVGDPAQLDLDWNSIFSTAKKVLPVVASAGYDIYKELSGNKIDAAQDPEGFLDTLSSIAKVAVPIAGTILSVL